MAEFSYKIEENYGVLSENKEYTTRFTKVAWNNGKAKFDLRSWKSFDDEEERKCGKGITLTVDEAIKLRDLLNDMELKGE